MVHFYIGKGKGKTSAALGLGLRAAGWGKSVYVAQFLKDQNLESGEVRALGKSKLNIKIERFPDQVHPLFLAKGKFNRDKTILSVKKALAKISGYLAKKKFDVFILDEILNLLPQKAVTIAELTALLRKAKDREVVLTGRSCPKSLELLADYISLIKDVKHPFMTGQKARKGIEY